MNLSTKEQEKYARHLSLPEFDESHQLKLKNAKVLVVGAGGLSCASIPYLVAAGIGNLGIIDHDRVSLSNLQRQVLYDESDIGKLKVEVMRSKLQKMNAALKLETYPESLRNENARELFKRYDLIIDGSDNFPTRYLCNDAAYLEGKALIYASVYRFEGQLSVFNYPNKSSSVNYRDLQAEAPEAELIPSCSEAGVLGIIPGIIGNLQALEAIKLITGIGEVLSGKLLVFDGLTHSSLQIEIPKNPKNPLSGARPTITELIDYQAFCRTNEAIDELDHKEALGMAAESDVELIDVRNKEERARFSLDSKWIALDQLEEQVHQLAKEKTLIFYCETGNRSRKAIQVLKSKYGFRKLFNLKGGIQAYKFARLESQNEQ